MLTRVLGYDRQDCDCAIAREGRALTCGCARREVAMVSPDRLQSTD